MHCTWLLLDMLSHSIPRFANRHLKGYNHTLMQPDTFRQSPTHPQYCAELKAFPFISLPHKRLNCTPFDGGCLVKRTIWIGLMSFIKWNSSCAESHMSALSYAPQLGVARRVMGAKSKTFWNFIIDSNWIVLAVRCGRLRRQLQVQLQTKHFTRLWFARFQGKLGAGIYLASPMRHIVHAYKIEKVANKVV